MSQKLRVLSGFFIALTVSGCFGSTTVRTVAVPCPSEKVVLVCPAFPEFEGKLSRHGVRK